MSSSKPQKSYNPFGLRPEHGSSKLIRIFALPQNAKDGHQETICICGSDTLQVPWTGEQGKQGAQGEPSTNLGGGRVGALQMWSKQSPGNNCNGTLLHLHLVPWSGLRTSLSLPSFKVSDRIAQSKIRATGFGIIPEWKQNWNSTQAKTEPRDITIATQNDSEKMVGVFFCWYIYIHIYIYHDISIEHLRAQFCRGSVASNVGVCDDAAHGSPGPHVHEDGLFWCHWLRQSLGLWNQPKKSHKMPWENPKGTSPRSIQSIQDLSPVSELCAFRLRSVVVDISFLCPSGICQTAASYIVKSRGGQSAQWYASCGLGRLARREPSVCPRCDPPNRLAAACHLHLVWRHQDDHQRKVAPPNLPRTLRAK